MTQIGCTSLFTSIFGTSHYINPYSSSSACSAPSQIPNCPNCDRNLWVKQTGEGYQCKRNACPKIIFDIGVNFGEDAGIFQGEEEIPFPKNKRWTDKQRQVLFDKFHEGAANVNNPMILCRQLQQKTNEKDRKIVKSLEFLLHTKDSKVPLTMGAQKKIWAYLSEPDIPIEILVEEDEWDEFIDNGRIRKRKKKKSKNRIDIIHRSLAQLPSDIEAILGNWKENWDKIKDQMTEEKAMEQIAQLFYDQNESIQEAIWRTLLDRSNPNYCPEWMALPEELQTSLTNWKTSSLSFFYDDEHCRAIWMQRFQEAGLTLLKEAKDRLRDSNMILMQPSQRFVLLKKLWLYLREFDPTTEKKEPKEEKLDGEEQEEEEDLGTNAQILSRLPSSIIIQLEQWKKQPDKPFYECNKPYWLSRLLQLLPKTIFDITTDESERSELDEVSINKQKTLKRCLDYHLPQLLFRLKLRQQGQVLLTPLEIQTAKLFKLYYQHQLRGNAEQNMMSLACCLHFVGTRKSPDYPICDPPLSLEFIFQQVHDLFRRPNISASQEMKTSNKFKRTNNVLIKHYSKLCLRLSDDYQIFAPSFFEQLQRYSIYFPSLLVDKTSSTGLHPWTKDEHKEYLTVHRKVYQHLLDNIHDSENQWIKPQTWALAILYKALQPTRIKPPPKKIEKVSLNSLTTLSLSKKRRRTLVQESLKSPFEPIPLFEKPKENETTKTVPLIDQFSDVYLAYLGGVSDNSIRTAINRVKAILNPVLQQSTITVKLRS